MSVANFGASIGMIIGIINGIITAMKIGPSATLLGGSIVMGVSSGIMTFCINVIIGTFLGFLGGAVIAFIYNIKFRWDTGGIEVELEVR